MFEDRWFGDALICVVDAVVAVTVVDVRCGLLSSQHNHKHIQTTDATLRNYMPEKIIYLLFQKTTI